jgi:capsular polysaccharide biosynthesis protein
VDLWKMVRILMRRWYVAVPLVLLALVGGLWVREGVQPGYTVTANVLVLPPSAGTVSTTEGVQVVPVNPLLGFSGSTQIAARALAILAQSTDFRARVDAGGGVASYSVATTEGNPILAIQVESKDEVLALQVASQVIDELGEELDRQQPSARPEQRLSLQTLAAPTVAAVDDSRLRASVVAAAIGTVLALALTVLLDGLLSRNARHRSSTAGGPQEGSPFDQGGLGASDG